LLADENCVSPSGFRHCARSRHGLTGSHGVPSAFVTPGT
jgi:hypothetical protein